MCCVCAQCRLPAGGGGCIAYAMSKLRVFATAKKATAALDRASEKVLAARRVGEPGHPEVKVYTRSLTWCPEAIQRALQASRCHFTKVRLECRSGRQAARLRGERRETGRGRRRDNRRVVWEGCLGRLLGGSKCPTTYYDTRTRCRWIQRPRPAGHSRTTSFARAPSRRSAHWPVAPQHREVSGGDVDL